MRNFQKRRGFGHIMQSIPVLVLLFLLVLFFAYSMIDLLSRMLETSKNKEIVENKITELQTEKEKLEQDIGKLNTPKGVEESIREKFGLVKEGEGMIVVVEDKNQPDPSLEANSGGFFYFFKKLFR